MIRTRRLGRPDGKPQDDAGVAILVVVMAIATVTALLVVALSFSIRNQRSGRTDQDAKTATAAAQAGIEEYLSRLNANSNYYANNNVDSANPAFTTGQAVQGTTSRGSYTYRVLSTATETAKTGIVRVKATGTAGVDSSRSVSRTLTANLRTKGFLNFIYLSEVEVTDPLLAGTNATTCSRLYYQGRNGTSGCGEIQWTGGDTVNGPLHSNDALQINGPVTFRSSTETSCPPTVTAGNTASCPTPNAWWGTQTGTLPDKSPKYAAPIIMPDANDNLATNTTPGADGAQTGPGCYYTGATRITFTGTTMSVLSPGTTSNKTPARCYNYQPPNTLQTAQPIPPVIYVDETASACTYRAVGYPATNEAVTVGGNDVTYWTSTGSNKTTNYRCGRGTAYVNGTADAQVTVAGADDIVVTGNLTTADNLTGTNVIGLIANNDVWVYHPLNAGSNELLAAGSRVTTIQAAILSVKHSLVVQNWADGDPLGTLNVGGAIAQKFRGPVGTGNASGLVSGYYKNYVYDARLAYQQPPYFLSPVSSEWHLSSVTDG